MRVQTIDLSSGIRLVYEDADGKTQTKSVAGLRITFLSGTVANELDTIAHSLGAHASFLRRPNGSYALNIGPEHVDLSKVD